MTIYEVLVNRKPHRVKVLEKNGSTFLVEVNKKTFEVKIKNPNQGKTVMIKVNGRSFQAKMERIQRNIHHVEIGGKPFEVERQPKTSNETATKLKSIATVTRRPVISLAIENGAVTAPIAGRIVLLRASVEQKVEKGECVCVLEAMKMENEIAAPKSGVVKEIRVFEGDLVNKGDTLAVIT